MTKQELDGIAGFLTVEEINAKEEIMKLFNLTEKEYEEVKRTSEKINTKEIRIMNEQEQLQKDIADLEHCKKRKMTTVAYRVSVEHKKKSLALQKKYKMSRIIEMHIDRCWEDLKRHEAMEEE